MTDFLAMADGLAARYDDGVVTPPTGYTNITLSTARLPNGLATLPAVLVFLENGEGTYIPDRRLGEHHFRVRFLYDKSSGDLRKEMVSLLKWLTVLWDQTHAATKLGVSGVMKALPTGYELGQFDYAGEHYDGFDILVTVWTEENVTLVAA
jgi:hypothetical protein